MMSFAFYRLPRSRQVVCIQQQGMPTTFGSLSDLNGHSGFVVAPFAIDASQPVVLIRPDDISIVDDSTLLADMQLPPLNEAASSLACAGVDTSEPESARAAYGADFAHFHQALSDGMFRKLVLARCATVVPHGATANPLLLFAEACSCYPQLFVSLVYTPQSGLWLTATPEILLESDGTQWTTIALAGTMPLPADSSPDALEQLQWSAKNREEQRIVADYIRQCLQPYATDVSEAGPRTVRAAQLVHLRSDFHFTLLNDARVGNLLHSLHPTPAVCGLPKAEAQRFILANEHAPRRYYSGFMGPLQMAVAPHGPAATHLYVSLRCMQLFTTHFRLYAGGGLLPESVEQQEWAETEAKMQTMRQLTECQDRQSIAVSKRKREITEKSV